VLGWLAMAALPANGLVLCHAGNGRAAIEVAHGPGGHDCRARTASRCGHNHDPGPCKDDSRGAPGNPANPADDGDTNLTDHGCVDEPIESDLATQPRVDATPALLPATFEPIADLFIASLLSPPAQPHESPPGDPAVTRCCIVLLI
jgi:hypothetical protein